MLSTKADSPHTDCAPQTDLEPETTVEKFQEADNLATGLVLEQRSMEENAIFVWQMVA